MKWEGKFRRPECIDCLQGKAVRLASTSQSERANKPLVNVSVDLWGPATIRSREGYFYFLTCYDDYSRHVDVTPLKAKSEAFQALQTYVNLVENQLDRTVKTIRSDQGGEFSSTLFNEWLKEKGIEHAATPTDAHNQNARVERVHLTLMNDVRTMLVDSQLDKKHWVDALRHSVYTRNRIPNQDGTTPIGKFKRDDGRTVDYSHMQAFGQSCIYRVAQAQSKLEPRGRPGRIIGYGTNITAYTVLDEQLKRVVVSRDVKISTSASKPTTLPEGDDVPTGTPNLPSTPLVDVDENEDFEREVPDNNNDDNNDEQAIEHIDDDDDDIPAAAPIQREGRGWVNEFIREPAPSPEVNQEDAPVEPERVAEIEEPRRVTRSSGMPTVTAPLHPIDMNWANTTLETALSAATDGNPENYQEARNSAHWSDWKMAMDEEMNKMSKYNVWEMVPNTGQRSLSGKWVFTRKIDGETGKAKAYKARFVVRGFLQREGRDYGELFASVVHKDTIRIFLAIVNHLDLECDQVDIVGAFLNGIIDREIFVQPPEGSNFPAGYLLRLIKSLYGLKQSPRLFNQKLDKFLRSVGLIPTKADPCMYIRIVNGIRLMVTIHVDDQLIACNDRATLDEFKRQLNEAFECKDQGPVGYFLGVNIYRDRTNRKMYLSQEHYLESVLERFGETGNACKTALPSDWKPKVATDKEFAEAKDKPFPQ